MATTTSHRVRNTILAALAALTFVGIAIHNNDPPDRRAVYEACMTERNNPADFDTIAACTDKANDAR